MTWITGLHRKTSTKELLNKVNWLSINQLVYYHGFLLIYKVKKNRAPFYNFHHLNAGLNRRGRIGLTRRRWLSSVQEMFNTLDQSVWNEEKISIFKKKVKTGIKLNIGVFNSND